MRAIRLPVLALLLVLLLATTAMANVIAPFVWLWPGVVAMSFPVSLPATVLAAFLERPFVSRSGIQRHALRYSLRANFLSLLVGVVLMPGTYVLMWTLGPLFFFWPLRCRSSSRVGIFGELFTTRVVRYGGAGSSPATCLAASC